MAHGYKIDGERPPSPFTAPKMSLELYIGPMFSGKSSAVLAVLRRNAVIGIKTLCITSSLDTRYENNSIVSHNGDSYPAFARDSLMRIMKTGEFIEATHIIVEEAQFFPDLKNFVLCAVDIMKKHVTCVGLDGDSNRAPFGQILDLIPHADKVHKLKALCIQCKDGTPAIYTSRTSAVLEQVNVGGSDQYEPLCRAHFLSSQRARLRADPEQLQQYLETYVYPLVSCATEYLDYLLNFVEIAECGPYLLKRFPLPVDADVDVETEPESEAEA